MPTRPATRQAKITAMARYRQDEGQLAQRLQEALGVLDRASDAWQSGKRPQAIRLMRAAIRTEEHLLGPDSQAVATARTQLGAYLLLDGHCGEAEKMLKRALGVLESHPDRACETVAARALLGEVYLKTARHAEAAHVLAAALLVCEEAYGAASPESARLLFALGLAREGLGQVAEAADHFARSLAISDAGTPAAEYETLLPSLLGALFRVHYMLGQPERGMAFIDRLLAILPDSEGDGPELGDPDGEDPA